jgi:hypothetical protein
MVDPTRHHDLAVHLHHLPEQRRNDDPTLIVHVEQLAVVDPLDQLEHGRLHCRLRQQLLLDKLPHRQRVDAELVGEEGAHVDLPAKAGLELFAQPGR